MTENVLGRRIEDHALESVPVESRRSWLTLSWNTAGIVTTLVQLFFGALVTFVAGLKLALMAGLLVTVVGGLLGWLIGHVAYRSGLSSTVMARRFGFGTRGSALASLIFAFMIIGFLALENALLYKGLLFAFGLQDTFAHRVLIYGGLSVAWIGLTAFGFEWVSKVSSVTLVAFLVLLAWMTVTVLGKAGLSMTDALGVGTQWPVDVLRAMGADTELGKFVFAVNVLIGSAGALALVDADLGRYARSSWDIGISAFVGNLCMDVLMLALGGVIMYAGVPTLEAFYQHSQGLGLEAARQAVIASPDSVAAAFIVFGGALGTVLMVLAQAKAQVLNTYSASLSLANLFDALFGWRPGRFAWVVLANLVGVLMLYGHLLALVNAWITLLGVLTTCFAGVIVADY
ncbi:MAG TPA: purine-cytosine permease-like transporter, partial [Burkholderiaceae bacterium]|nr:purine-cytosine permease-like transporter [Burkholderiaceae bacterium]